MVGSNRSKYQIPSVLRSGYTLRTLAIAERPLSISELSRMLKVPKATMFRILVTLEQGGFVERVDKDRFAIGYAAFEVGSAYTRRFHLESAFRHVARKLVQEYNETVQLAVLLGTDVLYIAKEECTQPVRLVSNVGTRLPASVTSLGKALLACLSNDEVNALYGHLECLPRLTPNSHTTLASLIADLERVRERGWAHDNEEAAIGLQCVGSAIKDHTGKAIAAISISVPSQRMSLERVIQLGEAVKAAARELSTMMAGLS